MNEKQRQDFIIKELEAIYCEYEACMSQLVMLKPFLNDLILVSKGNQPSYNLGEAINKSRK